MMCISSYAQEETTVSQATSNTEFNKDEFHKALLNGISLTLFLVYMIYGTFGIIANMVSDIIRRVPKSVGSPEKFSFKYWWGDNWQRVLASFVFLPLMIVACNEIFGFEITNFKAFCIGLGADHGAELLKRREIIIKGIQAGNQS